MALVKEQALLYQVQEEETSVERNPYILKFKFKIKINIKIWLHVTYEMI
jgi:hypothetical protein